VAQTNLRLFSFALFLLILEANHRHNKCLVTLDSIVGNGLKLSAHASWRTYTSTKPWQADSVSFNILSLS